MTLLHLEPFGIQNPTGNLIYFYDDVNFLSANVQLSSTTKFGIGSSIYRFSGTTCFITKEFTSANNTKVVGFRIYIPDTPSINSHDARVFTFYDGANPQWGVNLSITEDTGFTVQITLGDHESILVESDIQSFDTWHYIECKVVASIATSGSAVIHINENDTYSATSIQTHKDSTALTKYSMYFESYMTDTYYDDVYLLDGAGSVNNDFLGDIIVEGKSAETGTLEEWALGGSPSAPSNHEIAVSIEIAQLLNFWVYDSTIGAICRFEMSDLSGAVSVDTIAGLILVNVNRLLFEGQGGVKGIVESGGTDYYGEDLTLTSTEWKAHYDVFELDPDTGVAWTEAGINAAKIGIERTSP